MEKLILEIFSNNEWHTSKKIRNYCGIKSPVVLRNFIKKLRLKGHLIIANKKGYKLVNEKNKDFCEEINNYLNKRQNEIKKEEYVIEIMRKKIWEK